MVRPTQYIGWEGDSPAPTPTPIPRTCAELPLQPAIDQAKGLAVSPDGKYVYLSAEVKDQGAYLYQVEQGQPIRVLDLSATEVACDFRANILHKDSFGNVFLLKDKTAVRLETTEFSLYKIQPNKSVTQSDRVFHKNFGEPDPSPSGGPVNGQIRDLFIDEKNQTYVLFNSHDIEYPSFLYKLILPNRQNMIFSFPGQLSSWEKVSFDAENEKIYISASLFETAPFPKNFSNAKFIFSDKLNPIKGKVVTSKFWQQKLIITSDNNGAEIYFVYPDSQTVKKIAGFQPGYRDGIGEQAQFGEVIALDLDQAGNIYVLDRGNRAIRKITPGGVVSTFYKDPN